MTTLRFLGEESTADFGSKARVLSELAAQGFAVPPGFVVTPGTQLARLSDAELGQAVQRIGGFPVAVRSSGTLEDLEQASFAGQYVSYLEVSDLPMLRLRIEDCRASLGSDQVRSYLENKKIDPVSARMSVLVQKMVAARTAGVCFSVHPLTGREDHALIECCEGLGEKLVSGHITPARYVVALRDGKLLSEELPEGGRRLLSAAGLASLARAALRLQAHYGRPQDIEWAIDATERLWILQSRAVTSVQWRSDVEEYTNADFKDGGVSAKVCSPLMYSLYRDAMQESMPAYLRSIRLIPQGSARNPEDRYIDSFYGRPYWNASIIKRALTKVPGFDERSFDHDLGIQKEYGPRGPKLVPTNVRTILPALPVAVALEKQYKLQLERARAYGGPFLEREAALLARMRGFAQLDDGEFFALFEEVLSFHQKTECDYFTTIYNNSNAQADFKKAVERTAAALGTGISLIQLMAGLTDVSHMRIQQGLVRLHATASRHGFEGEAWRKALESFLRDNYFHGDSELDLTVPRWGENPGRIREIVAEWLASGHRLREPEATVRAQHEVYRAEKDRVLGLLERDWLLRMRLRSSFLKQLGRSRAYLSARETMREYSTRSYHLVRRYAVEAGARWQRLGALTEAAEIFMTTTDEIRAWTHGRLTSDQVREETRFRKLMYDGYRAFTPPDELGGSVQQRSAASYVESAEGRTLLRGTGCSPGVVEGEVRLVSELSEAGALRKGEILVTRFTDPGWTPVLGIASGVVTEVGGLLSHAAVIGREYGIPAVLNLRGATRALKTGQRVRVDGQAGTVEVI